jgi:CDP-glycerol glycerophosphotransferase
VSWKNYLNLSRLLGGIRRRGVLYLRKLAYRPGVKPINPNAVLFEAFEGKVIGDSPYEIFRYLKSVRPDLTFYWSVKPGVEAPDGSIGLTWASRAWFEALATSKYLVNNSNFPWYFRKVPGQVYLQTWHGTPLKRLGRDVGVDQFSALYQQTMDREAKAWDYLIAPNGFCAERFPGIFGYTGEQLVTGYPRNDRLSKTTDAQRQLIRAKLGVTDPSEQLVLYAPTWREFNRTATGNWDTVNFFDPNAELPEGFTLLFRGHHNTHAAHSEKVSGRAIDVTKYPDVTDLYLAADILVTDYSSVMFDYTVTGKPILFLAPDLERYRAERGFYLDYEAEVPGPIFKTADELTTALPNIDRISGEYAAKYRAWQAKFDHLEDGFAAKRVVERVWGNSQHRPN